MIYETNNKLTSRDRKRERDEHLLKERIVCSCSTWFIINVFGAIFVCDIHLYAKHYLFGHKIQNAVKSLKTIKKNTSSNGARDFCRESSESNTNIVYLTSLIHRCFFVNAYMSVSVFVTYSFEKLTALRPSDFSAYWQ